MVPTFCGTFWKSRRNSSNSWRCLVVPRTRNIYYYLAEWKLHRVWILTRLELLRWLETDILGYETENCQGSLIQNLHYQRKEKKEKKEETKVNDETEKEQEAPVSLVTHISPVFNFSQFWGVHQQSATLQFKRTLCAQILHFQQLQIGQSWIYGSFALRGVRLWSNSCWKFASAFFCIFSYKENKKNSVDPMASCCMINWVLTRSPFVNSFTQIWKIGYDYSESNLVFIRVATTPTLILELLIVNFTLIVLLSRMIITRNEWTCLHILLRIAFIWKL